MQYSTDELAEILKLHGMWRRAEPNGVRANLSGANLSRADLSRANLYGADLSGADHILRGPYLDGHEVFLVRFQDGPRYKAGCRWFTVAQAHEHWRDLSRHQREDAKRHCDLMLTGLAGLLEVGKLLGWEGCA